MKKKYKIRSIPCSKWASKFIVKMSLSIFSAVMLSNYAEAGDYEFNADEFKQKPFQINGLVELNPGVLMLDNNSPLYSIKYQNLSHSYLDSYRIRGELDGKYSFYWLELYGSGSAYLLYDHTSRDYTYDFIDFESYLKISSIESPLTIWFGKRVFKWGKGYVYNPTNFVARPKDLSDIDATQEGYWSFSAEYIKSINSPLSTVAVTGGVVPVYNNLNSGFLSENGAAGFIQLYLLLYNTDLDLVGFVTDNLDTKFGVGLSRNLKTNLEIHSEWAVHIDNHNDIGTSSLTQDKSQHEIVAGLRYLSPFTTTIILDYFHNGQGASESDMDSFYSNIRKYNAGIKSPLLQEQMKRFSGQFVMRDYVYLRLSHPEPFNLLYFTPVVYGMVNITDKSFSAGVELSYSRFTNTKLAIRYTALGGDDFSEYGIKPGNNRLEFRGSWHF